MRKPPLLTCPPPGPPPCTGFGNIEYFDPVQPDWEQTDNTKADFIKNKPDLNVMINEALQDSEAFGAIIGDLPEGQTVVGYVDEQFSKIGDNIIKLDGGEV